MSLKVYQMNEYDWMAANSKEEAIEVYKKDFAEDFDENDEIRECDLDNEGQYIVFEDEEKIAELESQGINEVIVEDTLNKKYGFGSIIKLDGEWLIKVTFRKAVENLTSATLTASKEY